MKCWGVGGGRAKAEQLSQNLQGLLPPLHGGSSSGKDQAAALGTIKGVEPPQGGLGLGEAERADQNRGALEAQLVPWCRDSGSGGHAHHCGRKNATGSGWPRAMVMEAPAGLAGRRPE